MSKSIAYVKGGKITDGKEFTVVNVADFGVLGKHQMTSKWTFSYHINPFYCKNWNSFWFFCDLLLINPLCSPVYAGPLPAAAMGALL